MVTGEIRTGYLKTTQCSFELLSAFGDEEINYV